MKKHFILGILLSLFVVSCTTTKEDTLSYFRNLNGTTQGVMPRGGDYEIRIVPDDELSITVASSVPEATSIYRFPVNDNVTHGDLSMQSQPRLFTYIVNKEGYIDFPVLGKLYVKGKTVDEVADDIKSRVAQTVKDPMVRVELLGYYVNVMGEVRQPQRIRVTEQRFTLLDALAAAGDLTDYALRDNVMVIREENGEKTYHRFDLGDNSIFASPYFNLRQNDVVYVSPNSIKIDNSKYNQNNAYKLSVVSTVVAAVSTLATLIIAITVK